MEPKYKRVLLKLSGEALSGNGGIIDFDFTEKMCEVIKKCNDAGVVFGIIIGGGNIWRGRQGVEVERSRSDQMGMLATAINSLAVQDVLLKKGASTALMSALDIQRIAESYSAHKAVEYMDAGKNVIIACGTGNPHFSTDTAASLRAAELGVSVILSAKNIDGVYDSDPRLNPDAKKYDFITYEEIIGKNLKIIDTAAAIIARDNKIPQVLFALNDPMNIYRVAMGESIGTTV